MMLSPETIDQLEKYRLEQETYQQDDTSRLLLAAKTVIAFVGAACEGKNSLMDAVTTVDDRFKTIGTITTRPPRTSDEGVPYTYFSHTDAGLSSLFEAINRKQLVQYFVNAASPHYIYGSRLEDYPGDYNVGDYFADSIADMRRRGFARVIACSVITKPELWQQRFNERFPLGNQHRTWRLEESLTSWQWSLDQQEDMDHIWVVNENGKLQSTAMDLIERIDNHHSDQEEARTLALESIQLARKISV